MANFNIDAKETNTYDAIVVGSGISGGWAAKELCEKGLKTLVGAWISQDKERLQQIFFVINYCYKLFYFG